MPDELLRAVRFDAEYYWASNPDVYDASADAGQHFARYGLREGRRPAEPQGNADEVAFWQMIAVSAGCDADAARFAELTLRNKIVSVATSPLADLAVAVLEFLGRPDALYFGEDLSLLIAQAALELRWAFTAEVFLNLHDEALAFALPPPSVPPHVTHVYEVATPHAYCADRGIPYRALLPARDSISVTPKLTEAGSPAPKPLAATELPPVIAAELSNVAVIGGTGAVLSADHVLLSADLAESCRDRQLRFKSPLFRLRGPQHVAMTTARDGGCSIVRAVSLLHDSDTNYFHFIVEAVPKMMAALSLSGADDGSLRLLVRSSLPRTMHEIVGKLLADREHRAESLLRIGDFARVDIGRLLFISDFHRFLVRDDAAPRDRDRAFCADTIRAVQARLDDGPEAAVAYDAIFVPRPKGAGRPLCNRAEVESALSAAGLEGFEPGAVGFSEQRWRFRRSFLVVGESGAAMTNLLFCKPGSRSLILSNANRYQDFYSFAALASAVDVELHYHLGTEAVQSDGKQEQNPYVIDMPKLVGSVLRVGGIDGDSVLPPLLERLTTGSVETAAVQLETGDSMSAIDTLTTAAAIAVHRTDRAGFLSGSKKFDELALEIGAGTAERMGARPCHAMPNQTRTVTLVSELYLIGGHSRVVEDIIKAMPEQDHHLIFTRMSDRDIPFDEFLRVGPEYRVTPHFLAGTVEQRLAMGAAILRRLRPEALFHLAHPDDVVAIAMMQPDSARFRIILDHNDHTFALGRYLPGAIHVGFSRSYCEEARRLWGAKRKFLPLSCDAEAGILEPRAGALITLTSGSFNKFLPARGRSYFELLRVRFAAREGNHFHVGELPAEQRREIDALLQPMGWIDRFIYVPAVRRLTALLHAVRPHLYLTSFPTGGGKATVEAMACGLPICAGITGSRLDGAAIGYEGSLKWRNPKELQDVLSSFTADAHRRHQALALSHFQQHHSWSKFEQAIRELRYGRQHPRRDRLKAVERPRQSGDCALRRQQL
ncbi:MAG: DUF563 domain-containing protein [Alphaproteobacteria bacterium]|nr:DUF563 domain-containing protein [Alphaproteobacteria bacterium]